MVLGISTAFRCKKCNKVFFQPNFYTPLTLLKKLTGTFVCPHCGSQKIFEDKTIMKWEHHGLHYPA